MGEVADRPPRALSRWLAAQIIRRRAIGVSAVLLAGCVAAWLVLRPVDQRVDRWTGRVVGVGQDGRLNVQIDDGAAVTVGLLGVTVPEDWRTQAAAWLAQRVTDKPVMVTCDGEPTTRQREMAAYVYGPDDELLNEAMVREGYGVAETARSHTLGPWLERLSTWAQRDRRGLWRRAPSP